MQTVRNEGMTYFRNPEGLRNKHINQMSFAYAETQHI